MVDRLCGIFPKDNIARNTVKLAWKTDELLIHTPVEEGRVALVKIENDPCFPSLARVKNVIRSLKPKVTNAVACVKCDGSGWDTGITTSIVDLNADIKHQMKIRTWTYTETHNDYEYTCVKRCDCSKEIINEPTVAMSYL
jgi:hypothetical protein